MAFRGEFSQKVDRKARVSVPAAFRAVIQSGDPDHTPAKRARFVMVYGGDTRRYLECYTLAGMRRLEGRIARMKLGDRRRTYLQKNLIRQSIEVEIDEDGRIVLPPQGREKIGLAGEALEDGAEAVFAGDLETFQVWNRADYDADMAGTAEMAGELLASGEDMLSLLPDDDDDVDAGA
ncbi:MAG TPA: division/cell wall cluster transcriptional repressor MraZ [Paracoccaceae bacterium]|nr:division/cell wall cluster transcriptional repressor MraZ [Paracoccaceae bacterium]HMO73250.1 division/cell wall cluster transcriptional repressor MraZ [Paracoccaceae bacterium]